MNTASRWRSIFTNAQSFFCGALQKCVHNPEQIALARQFADSIGKRNDFTEPNFAFIAGKKVLFDGLSFSLRHLPRFVRHKTS
jgi:hypothetical protein